MSSDSRIHSQVKGSIGTLTIDNMPKQNALSFDMWDSLPALVRALDEDPQVRVIVLRGAGEKAFASGSDISQFGERRNTPEGVALYNGTVDRAVASIGAARKPTIAWVHGYCFGGGLALALHCDLRIAGEKASFCIPAGKVGLGYNHLWMQRLTWIAGPARAKEILFTARRYGADEALRMGLVTAVEPPDELMSTALAEADEIAYNPTDAVMMIKELLARNPLEPDLEAVMERELLRDQIARRLPDHKEAVTAFLEKRQPAFNR
jgi:enoyl-CoA hydratase/carnithine racemase